MTEGSLVRGPDRDSDNTNDDVRTDQCRPQVAPAACTKRVARLSASEERALAQKIKAGDVAAQEQLITANLALVLRVVRDYERFGIPFDDLVQEGNLGLIQAVQSFDPSGHTARFASYARFFIHASLVRAVASYGPLVQIPEKLDRLRRRYWRAMHELRNRVPGGSDSPSSGPPSLEEVAAHLRVSSRRLLRAARQQGDRSLYPTLSELLSTNEPSPDQNVEISEDRARVHAALLRLSPFEAWVIRERYGLGVPSRGAGTRSASPGRRTAGRHEAGRAPKSGMPGAAPVRIPKLSQPYYPRSYTEIGSDCALSAYRISQVAKNALANLRVVLAPKRV